VASTLSNSEYRNLLPVIVNVAYHPVALQANPIEVFATRCLGTAVSITALPSNFSLAWIQQFLDSGYEPHRSDQRERLDLSVRKRLVHSAGRGEQSSSFGLQRGCARHERRGLSHGQIGGRQQRDNQQQGQQKVPPARAVRMEVVHGTVPLDLGLECAFSLVAPRRQFFALDLAGRAKTERLNDE
jgi:hypothetical protein